MPAYRSSPVLVAYKFLPYFFWKNLVKVFSIHPNTALTLGTKLTFKWEYPLC